MSRTEISLPPMEFDTNAFWFETSNWSDMKYYDLGNHALSHAILAVAPLYIPSAGTDLDCCHDFINCSRILIFDSTAGGNGCSAQLWSSMIKSNEILSAALELLEECDVCNASKNYHGGCPNCIHMSNCLKFNEGLHRGAAISLGRKLQSRVQQYISQSISISDRNVIPDGTSISGLRQEVTPRKKRRLEALQNARDLVGARSRNIVVGRPTWPTDHIGILRELDD